jgi:hypothetical protein
MLQLEVLSCPLHLLKLLTLSIEGIRNEISWVWEPTAYKTFLAMLTGLGKPEACFFSRIKDIFIENRG